MADTSSNHDNSGNADTTRNNDRRSRMNSASESLSSSVAPVSSQSPATTAEMASNNNDPQRESAPSLQASKSSLQSEGTKRSRPRPMDYGTTQSSISTVRPQLTTSPSTRRPQTGKRSASFAPHRGQEFSVDDDVAEVDEDWKHARLQTKDTPTRDRQLKQRDNTLRRRPTAQVPTLPRLQSEEVEPDDAPEQARSSGHDARAQAAEDVSGEPSSDATLQGENEEEAQEEAETPDIDDDEEEEEEEEDDDDDITDVSDTESFTLKDRQEAINETHPFGIRIWKPALYKKSRSVQRNAEGDIHSAPGGNVSHWLFIFNCLWTLTFGWWLALTALAGGLLCAILSIFRCAGCNDYGRVLLELAYYLFYPFGKYVKLEHDEAYLDEDRGEGRSISEYERWQTGDLEEGRLFFGPTDINRSLIGRRRDEVEDLSADETDSLLGRHDRDSAGARTRHKTKRRLFGRGNWDIGRVIFFVSFYCLITPSLFLVSAICWFLVFTIPMGKITLLLFYHLRRHPLALTFQTDSHYTRTAGPSSILVCTYRAVGLKYWKYTIDGTNIFLINLLGMVFFVIFDYFVLYEALGIHVWLTSPGFNFVLGVFSIIPLAYFIGQAVASISAQSSMGVGATINAFFSTIVEVFLYCVALNEGKSQLVEGSIIGSIFAGILFLPGISMCFGALKRKTQRFNVRSASVTNTMLLFAVIGAFGPTLFYQIYGSHELNCHQCTNHSAYGPDRDCRRCYFSQTPAVNSRFYKEAVRPYIWFAAILLFLSYVIGLLFTLRTHASVIWNNEPDEKREVKAEPVAPRGDEQPRANGTIAQAIAVETRGTTSGDIRDSQMYKRILNQSLRQAGVAPQSGKKNETAVKDDTNKADGSVQNTPYLVPPKSADDEQNGVGSVRIKGLSDADNRALVQQVAEMAATAATVAARDATKIPRLGSRVGTASSIPRHAPAAAKDGGSVKDLHHHRTGTAEHGIPPEGDTVVESSTLAPMEANTGHSGGHDAPNWSRTKSAVILLTATLAYAIIAEILVDTVDSVLEHVSIDQKFLGITLFALVPNTTEFLNAISFAMNGNIALSMEIGNSYALQVMLLQIPALVLYSAITHQWWDKDKILDHTFSLIFPQWDMVTVILGVFLMGYVVGEGKSNYFKGSSLILTYLVFVVGFWFTGYNTLNVMGIDPNDTLAIGGQVEKFWTVGHGAGGVAFPA